VGLEAVAAVVDAAATEAVAVEAATAVGAIAIAAPTANPVGKKAVMSDE
jgi:hypothetical protein